MTRYIPYTSKISNPNDLTPDRSLDLGDQSCGDLVMEIMKTIQVLTPGQILKVHATDPAASIDIGAWCAMQNHELIAGPTGTDNADYYIQKGESQHG
jgi:tRNA 2-thiouridine synthesizing protein A